MFNTILWVASREFDDTSCGCSLRCCEKLSSTERKRIFESFWATGNFDVQNAYLCGCMKVLPVSRWYSPRGTQSRRHYLRTFYVKRGSVSVRLCKKAFLSMHGVPNWHLDHALRAQEASGGALHCNQRGRHEPKNKTKSDTIDSIKAHINSFPHYKSHYSRKDNPNREILNLYLSVQKMYQLY